MSNPGERPAEDLTATLPGAVTASWRRFVEIYEPLRPDLYRYCRHLTRSAWDAEDMAQDTMARAFVTLGCMAEAPDNPRAWLFRVATNLWLNRARRARETFLADANLVEEAAEPSAEHEPREVREAFGTLVARLSPQERAAVVLKDAFDLSLEETAQALATTTGAVKAALHRGRGKLVEPEPPAPEPVVPAVLDAFCQAFNASDLERLTALLLDDAVMDYPGLILERGRDAVRDGSLRGTLFGCPVASAPPPEPPRCHVRSYRGEPVLLWWWGNDVHTVVRVELAGERIATFTNYYHAPDVVSEVCRELGVPFRTHGYRFWS